MKLKIPKKLIFPEFVPILDADEFCRSIAISSETQVRHDLSGWLIAVFDKGLFSRKNRDKNCYVFVRELMRIRILERCSQDEYNRIFGDGDSWSIIYSFGQEFEFDKIADLWNHVMFELGYVEISQRC